MGTNPFSFGNIASGVGAALGGISGMFPQTSTQNTNSNGTSNTASSQEGNSYQSLIQNLTNFLSSINNTSSATTNQQTTTPNLSPTTQAFIDQLTKSYSAQKAPSLDSYVANQTGNINANSDAQQHAVDSIMASRGLATSPVAASSDASIQQNRLNQINNVQQQAPLQLNQLQLQNLGAQASLLPTLIASGGATTSGGTNAAGQNATNTSQNQTGSSVGQGTTNQTGNQTTNTNQNSTTTNKSGGGVGGILSGLGGAAGVIGSIFSDKELKDDITPIKKATDKIQALKPKDFSWKDGSGDSKGFIAQDVEKILPDLVHDVPTGDGKSLKAVNYAGIIPLIVSAIQELNKKKAA